MGEFKPIETQEAFDSAIQERLEAQQKKYEGYMSPDDVQKKYEGYMSPADVTEKYKGFLSPEEVESKYKDYIPADVAAEKDRKIKEYETQSLKASIAEQTGLPRAAVEFIKGSSEEDIKKSAETMKTMFGMAGVPPLRTTETGKEKSTDEALRNTLRKLKGE